MNNIWIGSLLETLIEQIIGEENLSSIEYYLSYIYSMYGCKVDISLKSSGNYWNKNWWSNNVPYHSPYVIHFTDGEKDDKPSRDSITDAGAKLEGVAPKFKVGIQIQPYKLNYSVNEQISFYGVVVSGGKQPYTCLLYTSPSPRDS